MWLQLAAGCVGAALLLGPSVVALAQAPAFGAATSWTPLRLLRVKPFHDPGAGGRACKPRVHGGPGALTGVISHRSLLQSRLNAAVFACARDVWTGDVTISATVDARGNLTDVLSQGSASAAVRSCLTAQVLAGAPIDARGPGTLTASYWFAGDDVTR